MSEFEPPAPDPAAPSSAPAGWYPAPEGQRYWDGVQWTNHVAPPAATSTFDDDRQMAMFAHLGILVGGFIVPLIIMLTKGNESAHVRATAVEALNFSITLLIASMVAFVLIFAFVGILLFPAVIIAGIVFPIIAGVKCNSGEQYRYPVNIRLVT